MRAKNNPRLSRQGLNLVSLSLLLAIVAASNAAAQTAISWNATANGTWGTTTNWTGGVVPANSLTTNYASFNLTTGVTVTMGTTQSVAGIDFGSSAGAYTLSKTSSPSRTLTLGAYGIKTASTSDQLITGANLTLALGAASTFAVNGTGNLTLSPTGGSLANGGFGLTLDGSTTGIGTIGTAGNLTVIAGTGGVTKNGTGTWVLNGANTFTGGTMVNAGTLRLGDAAALGAAGAAVTLAGGTIDLRTDTTANAYNTTVTANSTILSDKATAASAGITHTLGTLSLGTQTLSVASGANIASNSAVGVTFGATTQTGNATFNVANNGTAIDTLTLGALAGGGSARTITKTNDGTLVFNANASSTTAGSSLIVNGGIAQVNTATALGSGNYSVTVNSSNVTGTAAFNLNNVSQTIGSLTFGGTGATTNALNSVATGTGTLTLGGGVTYDATNNPGSATISGNLALGATRTFSIANSTNAATELSVSAIVSGAGFGITKSGAGTLALSGANTYSGKTAIQDGTLSVGSLNKVTGGTASSNLGAPLTAANGTIDFGSGTTTGTLAYTGAGETTDRVVNLAGSTGGATIDSSGSGALTFSSALTATLAGAKTLTLTGTNLNANTFSGNIVDGSGTTAVAKSGSGTWALSGTNTYSGGATLNAGTLNINSATALGATASTFTINGGTFDNTSAGALTLANNNAQIWNSNLIFTGTKDLNLGTGAVTLGASSNVTVTAGTLTVGGAISGSGLGLTKSGAGTLAFGGANSYTGGTVLGAGTLTVGTLANGGANSSIGASTSAATNLVLNGGTLQYTGATVSTDRLFSVGSSGGTLDAGAGGGTVAFTNTGNIGFNGQTGTRTLTLTGTSDGSLASVLGDNSGASSLTKSGSGIWTLTGNNTYTGSTTLTAGTLTVSSGAAIGAATSALVVNSGTLNLNNSAQTFATLNGTGGTINLGAGHNLTVNGASTSTWTGNMSLNGSATITGGSNLLVLGDGSAFTNTLSLGANTLTIATPSAASITPTFLPNPAFVLDPSNIEINSSITGTGGLTKTGTGTLSLMAGSAGGNTFTGDLVITGGKVVVASTPGVPSVNSNQIYIGNSGSSGGAVNATLQAGQLSAAAGANMIGTYNAGTNASATNLTIYADGKYAMNQGANGFANLTLQGGLIDGGTVGTHTALTVTGGITTLASPQTAVIQNGNLLMSANNFTYTIPSGGTGGIGLRIDDLVQNGVGYTAGSAGTSFVKAGAGTMVLSGANGANTYQGITNVSAGILNIQSATALGQVGSSLGDTANGTVVQTGAQLQLEKSAGITVGIESLTLNGTGTNNDGALRNVAGNNTWNGYVYLGSDSRINADSGTTLTIANTNGVNAGIINGLSAGQSLTVGGAGNTTVNGGISAFVNNVTKGTSAADSGTLTLAGLNGYVGATNVAYGAVKVTNSNGLSGSGAIVSNGAALQFAQDATNANINVIAVGSTINGTGLSNGGAIENLNGSNTYQGAITLGSAASIKADSGSTLTLTGGVDVSAPSHNALTIGGAGNITENGAIKNGSVTVSGSNITSTGTGGTLTKIDSGTLTFGGGATSQLDGITLTLGNLTVTGTNTLVQSGALSSSNASNVLTIDSTNTVQAFYAGSTTTTFTGQMTGAGTLQKDGAGILVFNSSFDAQAAGLTLIISGGEIQLAAGAQIKVGTIHITGNTVLDFSNSTATLLQSTNLLIDAGVSVTVNNWASGTDFWMVQTGAGTTGSFYQPGAPNIAAVHNAQAAHPEDQITFANWSNVNTTWIQTPYAGFTNNEIRPIPEPATYGLIFFSSCLALVGWRRYARHHSVRPH